MKATRRPLGLIATSGAVLAAFMFIGWFAYQAGRRAGGSSEAEEAASAGPAAGWSTHTDDIGFSLEHPSAWAVAADRQSGRITIDGGGAQVVIWPLFFQARGAGPRFGGALVTRLASRAWPSAEWGVPRPVGDGGVRVQGRENDRVIVVVLWWTNSAAGVAASFAGAAAREADYGEMTETFSRLLASFRLRGAPAATAAGSAPDVSFVRWQDPREKAFSVDAPAGWAMDGGLFRVAAVDTRPMWRAVSPDRAITLAAGDAELPAFTLPSPMLAVAGFNEGSWYSPGYNVRMMVRRHQAGEAFVREYLVDRVSPACANVAAVSTRDRPDAVRAINAAYDQFGGYGMSVRLTAGEATFSCTQNGRDMAGYYFAGTQLVETQGSAIWNVEYLYGYLAPRARDAEAQRLLARMIQSYRIEPAWAAMQQQIAANTSKIVAATSAAISDLIAETFQQRGAVQDELSRRRSNAMLGVEDVVDPATGREIKVESGSNYYWIDQRGTIVGTNADTRPTLDFREVLRLP